jgi:hypothetical protein
LENETFFILKDKPGLALMGRMAISYAAEAAQPLKAGLPDVLFSNQKLQFG